MDMTRKTAKKNRIIPEAIIESITKSVGDEAFAVLLGERIKAYRKCRNLTQEALALEATMNPSMLGKIERGERNPQMKTLLKIARALEVSLSELVDIQQALPERQESAYIDNMATLMQSMTLKEQKQFYNAIRVLYPRRDANE